MIKEEKKDQTEVSAKKQQEAQLKKVGQVRPFRGHKLFKVNKVTLEILEVEYVAPDTISFAEAAKGKKVKKKVIAEEGFAYFSALNKKNVIKKIKKLVDPAEVDKILSNLEKRQDGSR